MKYGKKNIIFGFFYIIITLGLGLFIVLMIKNDKSFATEPFSFPRVVMRAAHAHGNLESVLNIIIGLIVDRLKVADGLKKTISVLIIFGAIMHSGMLLISAVIPVLGNLAVVGALTLIGVMVLMVYGVIKGIE